VQAFPVVRLILPGEFSLGVHCDAAYGFLDTLNIVLPLTASGGASALHVESAPGAEDFHVLNAAGEGSLTRFFGARCLHWTSENTTAKTRASLDCRVIWGDGDSAAVHARYETPQGHFVSWRRGADGAWARDGPLPPPDARLGYPFIGLRGADA
jgi:hypothetical protein